MKPPFTTGVVIRVPRAWGSPQVVAWAREQGWRVREETKRDSPACLLSDEVEKDMLCADWLVNLSPPVSE